MALLDSLLTRLEKGHDDALLRFGLGKACLDADRPDDAIEHLRCCLAFDGQYSAAWKLLGKAYLATGDHSLARQSWQQGSQVAQSKGDKQAEKEMTVFLRRLDKVD